MSDRPSGLTPPHLRTPDSFYELLKQFTPHELKLLLALRLNAWRKEGHPRRGQVRATLKRVAADIGMPYPTARKAFAQLASKKLVGRRGSQVLVFEAVFANLDANVFANSQSSETGTKTGERMVTQSDPTDHSSPSVRHGASDPTDHSQRSHRSLVSDPTDHSCSEIPSSENELDPPVIDLCNRGIRRAPQSARARSSLTATEGAGPSLARSRGSLAAGHEPSDKPQNGGEPMPRVNPDGGELQVSKLSRKEAIDLLNRLRSHGSREAQEAAERAIEESDIHGQRKREARADARDEERARHDARVAELRAQQKALEEENGEPS